MRLFAVILDRLRLSHSKNEATGINALNSCDTFDGFRIAEASYPSSEKG